MYALRLKKPDIADVCVGAHDIVSLLKSKCSVSFPSNSMTHERWTSFSFGYQELLISTSRKIPLNKDVKKIKPGLS